VKGVKSRSLRTKEQKVNNFKDLHHSVALAGSSSKVNSQKGGFPVDHYRLDANHHHPNGAKQTRFCFSTK
ncbi:unnamed protein product, partial [Ilex paraguariensis]